MILYVFVQLSDSIKCAAILAETVDCCDYDLRRTYSGYVYNVVLERNILISLK